MTPSQLKAAYKSARPDGHFFDRATMKAFGDTMSNFGCRQIKCAGEVVAYELYRKRPVKGDLWSSTFFCAKTFRKITIHEIKDCHK